MVAVNHITWGIETVPCVCNIDEYEYEADVCTRIFQNQFERINCSRISNMSQQTLTFSESYYKHARKVASLRAIYERFVSFVGSQVDISFMRKVGVPLSGILDGLEFIEI